MQHICTKQHIVANPQLNTVTANTIDISRMSIIGVCTWCASRTLKERRVERRSSAQLLPRTINKNFQLSIEFEAKRTDK